MYYLKSIPFMLVFLGIITFGFGQNSTFPYQLNKTDFSLIAIGLSSKIYSSYLENQQTKITTAQIFKLDKMQINTFDRSATKNWNEKQSKASDLGRAILFASPSAIGLSQLKQKNWENICTYTCMYFEVALVTWGFTDIAKTTTNRIRPYLYNNELSTDKKSELLQKEKGKDSFFSGHTSMAFASAIFLSKTYSDIYGQGAFSNILWASSITLASVTGYLRYSSGNHFPTDVIAGAAVGSVIGYIIPAIHKSKSEKLSFVITPELVYWAYTF